MPKSAIHFTFFFLLITALSGVFMRYVILFPDTSILTYNFVLHGHSHLAILGWAFLGVFIVFLTLIWDQLKEKKQAKQITVAVFIITVCMFISFLYQGYAVFSIVFSTLHIVVEYWAAFFVFKLLKNHPTFPVYSKLFIKGAIISLVISTLGPFTLGGLGMAGMKETPFFDMAIYIYLHFQYNGWLFLILAGLFLFIMDRHYIKVNGSLLTCSFWIYMVSLFPGAILTILWYGLGSTGMILGIIGAIGQLTGVVLFLYAIMKERAVISMHYSSHIQISLLFIFILLLAKSLMELGLLYTPFATLIFETRSVVIGYLHLTLLGFVSISILTQYQMIGLLDEGKKTVLHGIGVFIIGFLLNEVLLFAAGLADWLNWKIPLTNELLFTASILLVIGIAVIWSSIFKKTAK